ncbi:MAG TPA: CoA pyrophosphatase [Rhizomicrobium sp.]|jgi:8-oxo-dGTP pyrophosphatase MutT (NUDIX family)
MNVHETPPHHLIAELMIGETDALRAALLREAPSLPLAPKRGDFDLNPSMRPKEARPLQAAAVLMPIIAGDTPRVLFTERAKHLTQHAGQVSFPGGRADDTDVSLVQTALRETHEETGIEPAFVTVAGFLDTYETGSGYAILPVVGVLSEGYALRPGAAEVERIFEVPLAFLLDPKNREQGHGQWLGHKRAYYAYHYAGHRIWGATAAMIVNFAERFAA